ncbi:MFS transporter [Pelobacter seleniigenes]|uniref:MFS transporter n=1 Tax=Pelobacter seleniigenes TaxID=407188 RepID=UPI000561F8A9|nr:MFS transporter [Pelobacter seleniigenes]
MTKPGLSPRSVLARLPCHYGWVIVATACLTVFSCLGLARFAFGMLLPGMQAGLAMSYEQMGYLGTANFVGYLLSVALLPALLKRLRPRLTIGSGLLLIAVTMAVMAQAGSFKELLVLYALTGAGSGLANLGAMLLIAHWFRRDKRGQAAGLMVVGSGAGIIFSGQLIPWLNRLYGVAGWRYGWLLLAAIVLGVVVICALLIRNEPADLGLEPVGRKLAVSVEAVGADVRAGRAVVLLGLLYLAYGATYSIYGTFVVTSMIEDYGFSEAAAGQFWSWIGFFSLFSGVLFGSLSDRIGRKGGLMAVFAVQTLGYLLAGSGGGTVALLASVFLFGIAAWAIPAIMTAAIGDYLGLARAAWGYSLITFFFAGGQTVGPAVAGVLAEHYGSFAPAFLLAAAITAGAFLLTPALPQPARH